MTRIPPSANDAGAARSSASWIALIAILAVTALLRLRLLDVPLERDEGEYAYMGQLIRTGEVPYLAAHNMKLPGVYYAYAGILSVFGETDVGIRLGLLVINLVAIVLLYHLGRKVIDAEAGLCAAAVYAVLSLSQSVSGFAANAEHFVVVPMLGGMILLLGAARDRRSWRVEGAGLLLGVAVLMKQQAAAFVAFAALYLIASGRESWRRAAVDCVRFAVASFVPFGLACLGMYVAGSFGPFWFWTVTYARQYVSIIPLDAGLRQLMLEFGRILGASPGLWLLVAVGLTALWWDGEARRRAAFLGTFAVFSFVAVCPGLRFSHHYFILLLPAASLLAAVAVAALAHTLPAGGSAVRVGVPLVASAVSLAVERAYLFLLPPIGVSRAVYGSNPFPEAVEIARWLRESSNPEDRIAVVGSEPQIYFYARRRAATSYMYTYPMMEAQPFSRRMQEEMIAQIERERPRFVVLVNVDSSWSRRPDSPTRLFEWASEMVNSEYRPVGLAEIVPGEPTVYRWDGDARDAPRSRFYVTTFERRS